jgi:hypothetical protein
MARKTDKSADSTSDEVPSANTDALMDAIPGVLSKTVDLSSNLPPPLVDIPNDPDSISEELHSGTIDALLVNTLVIVAEEAPDDAEETSGVSIDFADAVAGATVLPPPPHLAHPPLWNAWWCRACTVRHFVGDGGELIGPCQMCHATSPVRNHVMLDPDKLDQLSRTPGLTYTVLNPSATFCIGKTSSNTPNTSENDKLPGTGTGVDVISNASPGGTNSMVGDDAPRMDNDSVQLTKIDGGCVMGKHPIRLSTGMTSPLMSPLAKQNSGSCPSPGRATPHHQAHPLVMIRTTQIIQLLRVRHVSCQCLITIILHLQCTGIRTTFRSYSLHMRDLRKFRKCSRKTAWIWFVHASTKFGYTQT